MNNCRLADVCLKITDGSHFSPQGISEGYPMLSVKDMSDYGFSYASCKYISKEDYEKMLKNGCVPKKNDVLIAKDGSYLKHVFIVSNDKEQAILSSIGILRPNLEKVTPQFIKYYLSLPSIKEQVARKYVTGTALPRIILKNFSDIAIPLIDIDNQKNITYLLEKLDSKIENNTKQIEFLESLAKTIYDYWFVQFDFPNEDGKPYKSSGGRMVWDNYIKREIPEGWDVKKIKEIESNIITGKTPSTKDESNFGKDIPFITIGDIRGKSFVTNTEISLSFSGANSQKNKFIPKHSLCVTCIATPGLIGITTKESQTNQQINSINCKYEQNLYYLFFAIKDYFKYSSGAKTGNTFLNMNKEDFSNIELVYNKNVIKQFYETVCGIFNQIEKNELCNQKLCELKDWILPLLMNGQVHV